MQGLLFFFFLRKERRMNTLLLIVLLTLSLIGNLFLLLIRSGPGKPDGLLNVDTRDPDKDYYDFVFLIPTGDIPKRRFLNIEVHTKGENTQGENS